MDRQKTFETIVRHLAKQGRRAMTGPRCSYRAADGCRCAIGILIPDDAYDARMEGKPISIDWLRDYKADAALDNPSDQDVKFLKYMQRSHDTDIIWQSREHFLEVMRVGSQLFDLSIDFIPSVEFNFV